MARNQAFDGRFVYGVTTTAIYCRPSCPSRKPRRGNMVAFNLPELARQAGFRPCKRCRPDDAVTTDPKLELVRAMCHFIEANLDTTTLKRLSQKFNKSPAHLQRIFSEVVGISPQMYLEACRIAQFKTDVQQGEPIAMATYAAGYSSPSQLYSRASSELGMTPKRYGQKGLGMVINYSVTDSPLGKLLIGATEKGLCAVQLGDSEEELIQNLKEEFANATLQQNDAALKPYVTAILTHLAGDLPHLALPLDIRATAFQRQVWHELQKIPYGETRSYAQIAAAIGQPSAVRAVAGACAKNSVGIVIPCHRVVRGDGTLSGYRWGVARKAKLLELERVHNQ
jgi:AraC family transcriptional regulator of adaptative response/methylated-DNA-[protein]-cysteine methyltransferase